MRKLPLCSALVLLCLLPALASEPGESLDCQDFTVHMPGLSLTTYLPSLPDADCDTPEPMDLRCSGYGGVNIDAEGASFPLRAQPFVMAFHDSPDTIRTSSMRRIVP
jgi:hypothetical protein